MQTAVYPLRLRTEKLQSKLRTNLVNVNVLRNARLFVVTGEDAVIRVCR